MKNVLIRDTQRGDRDEEALGRQRVMNALSHQKLQEAIRHPAPNGPVPTPPRALGGREALLTS